MKLASAEEIAKTWGGMYIFVKIDPLLAIASAEANSPWLKKLFKRIPANRYGAYCWFPGSFDEKM